MPKSTDDKTAHNSPGTKPKLQSQEGGVNPSAPTTGTEGWGDTSDERQVMSTNHPAGTRAGQMRGNPGDNMTAAVQRESDRATTNKRPESERSSNQADLSRRTSGSAHSVNSSQGGTEHTFRCADVGNADCRWETSGQTEDEVMRNAEAHGRRHHGLTDWTEAMRNKVRDNIHRRQAA